jgi:aminoglycoside phosphotransferase (APT) family kinase protein
MPDLFRCALRVMTLPNLTVDTVVPYLVERDLVDVAAIVEGDLEVVDVGRRNENLKIICQDGPSYLLKQPGEGEPSTDATIRYEAAFYSHCQLDPNSAELRNIIPGFQGWDENRHVLILELVDGRPLWAHYASITAPEFPSDSAEPLGEALGTLHRIFRERSSRPDPWMVQLLSAPPWILFAHRPAPQIIARLSPASLQVLKLLQQDRAMTAGLDSLRGQWMADTLIHGDIKGDNVLVTARADEDLHVYIVDWELIQVGDAAWDVGSIFRDFLGYWLLSVPLSGDLTPEQMLESAQIPLANLHPATRAFWNAYCHSARLDANAAGDFLLRSVRFAAARMAQGAYELSAAAPTPSNLAIAMLQLAANILADPRDALLHLLGIPPPWKRTGHAAGNG